LVGIVAQRAGFRGAFWLLSAAALGAALLTLALASARHARATGALRAVYAGALRLAMVPRMALLLLVGTTLFIGYLGSITYLTLRLAGPPFNYSSGAIGWLSLTGLSAVLGAPIAGSLTHRLGLRRVLIMGMVLALIGLVSLSAHTWIGVALGMTSLYLGVFATQPAMLLMVTATAPANATGSASSLYLLSCLAGGSLGTVLLASIWGVGGWTGVTAACFASLVLAFGIALTQTGRTVRHAPAGGT
jgi:YNFM family putative membrane transporter